MNVDLLADSTIDESNMMNPGIFGSELESLGSKIQKIFLDRSPENIAAQNGTFGTGEKFEDMRVIFINGIYDKTEAVQRSAKIVSDIFQKTNVHFTHSSTSGYLSGCVEALRGFLGWDIPPVGALVANIRLRLDEIKDQKDGKVVILAHSKGGIVLDLVKKHLTPEERSKLKVYTLGSAIILQANSFGSVKNYVNSGDWVTAIANPKSFISGLYGEVKSIVVFKTSIAFNWWDNHILENKNYLAAIQEIANSHLPKNLTACA